MSTPPPESERGILHPREQARHRSLSRLAAGPEVGRFVEWYWIVEWDLDEPYTAEVLPFPSVNITFEQPGGAFVNGVCTRKFERELVGRGRAFGVKFWAGGFGAVDAVDAVGHDRLHAGYPAYVLHDLIDHRGVGGIGDVA